MDVSNADRVVFPEDGITKGEIVTYYRLMAPQIFPFIDRRALTVQRFPRGLAEGGFMQKNAPPHFGSELIERKEVAREGGGTTVYPVARSEETIPAFANLGVITFHVPPATVDDELRPDWVIWDLDPPDDASQPARRAALALRDVLEALGLSAVLMTSGSKGYHLRVPLIPGPRAGSVAAMARGVSALAAAAHPDLLTLAFRKADRGDRVFVDWLRNAPYSTSVVPWSLRPRSGAPVAAPIAWDELGAMDPRGVTMRDVLDRPGTDAVWTGHEPVDVSSAIVQVESSLDTAGIELEPFDRFRS